LKHFTLCADDFGLNDHVNKGILDLVESGRINAVSCMSVCENLANGAEQLKTFIAANLEIQVGLHVTLTEYAPLTSMPTFTSEKFPSIGNLLLRTHSKRISPVEIENEISAQVNRFEEIFGFSPHFLDGHQHAHILPGIRQAVVKVAKERLSSNGWIRSCYQPIGSILSTRTSLPRTLLISLLARGLAKLSHANGIASNKAFYGVNNFTADASYRELMKKWLAAAAQDKGSVVCMCHPAIGSSPDSGVYDPIAEHRPYEHAYLSSDGFLQDLRSAGIEL